MYSPARIAALLAFSLVLSSRALAAENYDESKVLPYTLPDVLLLKNGQKVRDADTWFKQRRPEILKDYETYIYGRSPAQPEMYELRDFPKTLPVPGKVRMAYNVFDTDRQALGGKAVRKQIDLSFPDRKETQTIHILMFTPTDVKPAPLFLCLSFDQLHRATTDTNVVLHQPWDRNGSKKGPMPTGDNRGTSKMWRVNDTLARGYGIAIIDYNDIEPDLPKVGCFQYGVRPLTRLSQLERNNRYFWPAQ